YRRASLGLGIARRAVRSSCSWPRPRPAIRAPLRPLHLYDMDFGALDVVLTRILLADAFFFDGLGLLIELDADGPFRIELGIGVAREHILGFADRHAAQARYALPINKVALAGGVVPIHLKGADL